MTSAAGQVALGLIRFFLQSDKLFTIVISELSLVQSSDCLPRSDVKDISEKLRQDVPTQCEACRCRIFNHLSYSYSMTPWSDTALPAWTPCNQIPPVDTSYFLCLEQNILLNIGSELWQLLSGLAVNSASLTYFLYLSTIRYVLFISTCFQVKP